MTEVRVRALRTVAQNLLFDVLLAVVVVVLPAVSGSDLTAVNWSVLGLSALKTAVVTVLSGVHRWLDERRAGA